jgi:hypothetical protein
MLPIQVLDKVLKVSASSVAHNKRLIILSCTHLFHEFCISNFENFLGITVAFSFINIFFGHFLTLRLQLALFVEAHTKKLRCR